MTNLPILRPQRGDQPPQMVAIAPSVVVIPQHVDERGLVAVLPANTPLDRAAYMDGEQLLAAFQGVMRHELRAAMTRAGMIPPDAEAMTDYLTTCSAAGCTRPIGDTLELGVGPLTVRVPVCLDHARELITAQALELTEISADSLRTEDMVPVLGAADAPAGPRYWVQESRYTNANGDHTDYEVADKGQVYAVFPTRALAAEDAARRNAEEAR